jgi:hypothetical protein
MILEAYRACSRSLLVSTLLNWYAVHLLDELLLVTLEWLTGRSLDDLGSSYSLLLDGRETSGKDGLTDEGDGHTHVESVDGGPLSGTLLSSGIEDLSDHGDTVLVVESEDISGDLDEERV